MAGSRILVVDDNHSVADTMATLVRLLGHECVCAYDGRSALALALEYRPEIVLLDLKMPPPDGFAVARALREAKSPAKIIAITGFGESVFTEKPLESGFDGVLLKPTTAEELSALLIAGPRAA